MKHFFAISVYDKFTEVRVLVDILRENWEGDYGIVVYSSHPDAARELADLDVDCLIAKSSYPYQKGAADYILTARIFDSIRILFEKALELNAESVTHLHSDSWLLCEKSFLKLLARLSEKPILARGAGLGERGFLAPLGVISDMFMVFSADWIRESGFLKARASDFPLDILNIHGVLSILIFANGGLSAIDFYDDYQEQEIVPGLAKKLPSALPSYPSILNRRWGLLHVHTGCFPDEMGPKLQAAYLKLYKLEKGKSLQAFQEGIDAELVFEDIRGRFQQYDEKLKVYRLEPQDFDQDLQVIENLNKLSSASLWKLSLKLKLTKWVKKNVISRRLAREASPLGGVFRPSRSLVFDESVESYYAPLFEELREFERNAEQRDESI